MSYVLDSTVLIDHLRSHPGAISFLRRLESTPLCSEVSRVEVLRGLRSGERRGIDQLLDAVRWQAVDETVATRAGELGRAWRSSHRGIGVADLVVAATAELSALPLATSNVKHFPMFEGLEPAYR